MKQNALIWLPGIFATILGAMPSAMAGPTLTYVKTLGQSNVKGSPLRTAGSRISVDQDGNPNTGGSRSPTLMPRSPWSSIRLPRSSSPWRPTLWLAVIKARQEARSRFQRGLDIIRPSSGKTAYEVPR